MARQFATWPHHMIQMGRETTPGTAVAATTVWRGPVGGYMDNRQREEAEEDIGLIMASNRAYDIWADAKVPFPDAKMTFEQINHIFEGGIMTATPTGTGTYTRVYNWVTGGSAQPAFKPYTLEVGNTLAQSDGAKIPFCYVTDFQFSGKAQQAWMMGGNWQGQQLTALTAFTSSVAKPTVEVARFAMSKLYIDEPGGTLGATQLTNVFMGFDLKCNTGIEFIPVGDGNLYYTATKRGRPEITFSLTLELEEDSGSSIVATERSKFKNNTFRQIRVEILGASSKKIMMDLAARYTSVGQPQKSGSNNTTVTFEGKVDYSSTDDLFADFTTVTSLATIP